ncbi:hypothetical protein L3Q65_18190 [Amycolatopsis sp. FU40]|uniref:hypothetical protein n=1 Tax=Amycolatopsis sp. FU40 TaxID=2914159 RepID=UPI001F2310ED|nr:hypothetical protein [Amycolatopsis sp. FU40]UKD58567.1 hypothetical protein L3Q65_18190 [Amycolatopsis sp. FU40]
MLIVAVGSYLGLAVGCSLEFIAKAGKPAGQWQWSTVAHKADMFSRTHGRQAMQENGAPQALHMDHLLTSAALWWVTTAVVAILIAVFVLHRHIRSRHLRSRVRYDLLPTAAFEPSLPAVLAFAHQLGRARPVHGWVPRSVVGVRVRFGTDPDFGKMVMSIEGRESIAGVLNKLSYPQVEIRRATPPGGGETTLTAGGETTPGDAKEK